MLLEGLKALHNEDILYHTHAVSCRQLPLRSPHPTKKENIHRVSNLAQDSIVPWVKFIGLKR